jgi:hypothetical protein
LSLVGNALSALKLVSAAASVTAAGRRAVCAPGGASSSHSLVVFVVSGQRHTPTRFESAEVNIFGAGEAEPLSFAAQAIVGTSCAVAGVASSSGRTVGCIIPDTSIVPEVVVAVASKAIGS